MLISSLSSIFKVNLLSLKEKAYLFKKGEFLIGSRDVCLGEIHGCRFYMASDQFEYYKNMHISIDVSKGCGSSFSLEIPLGLRFMSISRIFTDEELKNVKPVEYENVA